MVVGYELHSFSLKLHKVPNDPKDPSVHKHPKHPKHPSVPKAPTLPKRNQPPNTQFLV